MVSKSKLSCFLLKSKRMLMIEQKPFVLWSIKRVTFFGTPGRILRITELYNVRTPCLKPKRETVCRGYSWPFEELMSLKWVFCVDIFTVDMLLYRHKITLS